MTQASLPDSVRLMSDGWPKPLYVFASVPYRGRGPVMIVEAPLDVLTLRQWGHDAVAVAGGEMKREHSQRLRDMNLPLVIIPNNDAPAEREQCAGGKCSWLETSCACPACPGSAARP